MTEAISFLLRAKRATYAGNGRQAAPSRPNSHDLPYREGDLFYYDTYLGGSRFIGEEALWNKEVPFWGMNYSGRLLDAQFSFDFLKEALLRVSMDMPFRGPEYYRRGDHTYRCHVTGSFEWFWGYEEVFFLDRKVYECYFHGGLVK